MALNFPNNPTNGEIYLASNGVNYQWDGVKWNVYYYPGSNETYWVRDGGTNTLSQLNAGDDLDIDSSGGTTTFTVDASTGNVTSLGEVTAAHFDIESLTDLP